MQIIDENERDAIWEKNVLQWLYGDDEASKQKLINRANKNSQTLTEYIESAINFYNWCKDNKDISLKEYYEIKEKKNVYSEIEK
jgi:hypothetical protein